MSVSHVSSYAETEPELGILLLVLLKRFLPAVTVGCLEEIESKSSPRFVHYYNDIQAVQIIILQKITSVN
jgi:hypothetical protein